MDNVLQSAPWHEIVTHVDKDGEPTGGFILPRTVDDEMVERLCRVWRELYRGLGLPTWVILDGDDEPLEVKDG